MTKLSISITQLDLAKLLRRMAAGKNKSMQNQRKRKQNATRKRSRNR